MPTRRQKLLGIWIDCIDTDEAVSQAVRLAEQRPASLIISGNLNFADLAARDEKLQQCNRDSALTVADGMPLVVASWATPFRIARRLPGSELLWRLCEQGSRRGQSFFFVGRRPSVTTEAIRRLQNTFPEFRLAGVNHVSHPISAEETRSVIEAVGAARPHYLILALGQPQGELWAQAHLAQLDAGVVFQVGNALDLISGFRRRVPPRLGDVGLEWLYRLLQEPKRLGPRYLANAKHLARHLWFG